MSSNYQAKINSHYYIAVDIHGMPNVDTFVELYQKFSRAIDPVMD